jgi:iron complex transport system substrate-binding protein
MQIVSLLSGATELVCALGAGDELVGRSHECDWPEWVKSLPCCTAPTFDVTGSSLQIDHRVRELLREQKPLYRVDGDLLHALRPDVVITQAHCDVCAVGPADVARDAATEVPRILDLTAATLDQMFDAFVHVARGIGREEQGIALLKGYRDRLGAIARSVTNEPHHTIECIEWIDPVFPMANWSPELVELAGGDTRLGRPGIHSAATPWERILEADPEVLLIAPCGFGIPRTRSEMPTLTAKPGWNDLRAVRTGRVFLADGNRYFNRSGPSIVETAEILAEILHPHRFPSRHEGSAWVRW